MGRRVEENRHKVKVLRRDILRAKHQKDYKTEIGHKVRIRKQLCSYLMGKANESLDPEVQKWGFKLTQLLKDSAQ